MNRIKNQQPALLGDFFSVKNFVECWMSIVGNNQNVDVSVRGDCGKDYEWTTNGENRT